MSEKYVRLTGDKENPVNHIEVVEGEGTNQYNVTIDGKTYQVEAFPSTGRITLIRDGRSMDLQVEQRGEKTNVRLPQGRATHELMSERVYDLQVALGGGPGSVKPELKSPMAGKVVLVPVEEGQEVKEGETLIIVEAMKMENEIRAEADLVVKSIKVDAGDLVEPGQILMEFDVE